MANLSKIIDVHSHPILPFGEGAPVGEGRKQPDRSVESALSYMEEHDISAMRAFRSCLGQQRDWTGSARRR